jgi:H+/gluconate symporter-like permease
MSATHGYVMPGPGSVVACSMRTQVTAVINASLTLEIRVNGKTTLTATAKIPTTGYYSLFAMAAPGTHPVAAGDLVQFYVSVAGTSLSREKTLALAEVQSDT